MRITYNTDAIAVSVVAKNYAKKRRKKGKQKVKKKKKKVRINKD